MNWEGSVYLTKESTTVYSLIFPTLFLLTSCPRFVNRIVCNGPRQGTKFCGFDSSLGFVCLLVTSLLARR
jgi:hypothetical protein